MAIVNRDLDSSEQKRTFSVDLGAVATGLTLPIAIIPYPAAIVNARVAAVGVSGTPTALLFVQRFITGSGATGYLGGMTTLTMQAVGTSGIQSVVTAASGSTALNLQAGDVIMLNSGGANSAVAAAAVSITVQATQDIRTSFGS